MWGHNPFSIMNTKQQKLRAGAIVTVLAGSALIAVSQPGAHQGHHHGTDILHYFIQESLLNDGVLTNASGLVQAQHNQQGHSDHQRLTLLVSGLETNTTYSLYGLVGDDTNLTWVVDFTSDDVGRASLRYGDFSLGGGMGLSKAKGGNEGGQGQNNGNGHGQGMGNGQGGHPGKNLDPLPTQLSPVNQIRELDVVDASTQAVVTADFTMPDVLRYLVKRDLSTNSVDAMLRIHATSRWTQFRLIVNGLNAQQDYWLAVNGSVTQTNATDADGRLWITSLPEGVTNILEVQSLALWDTASNVVFRTVLP